MRKTHDYIHHYRGYWRPGGICRIQIYQELGRAPVMMCSELPENDNTSITNMAEYLAAEVVRAHFPCLFDAIGEPFVWLEHYPRDSQEEMPATCALVRFDSYTPRPVMRSGGVRRLMLGRPYWTHISTAAVEELIGAPIQTQHPAASASHPEDEQPS